MRKIIFALFVIISALFSFNTAANADENGITVYINETELNCEFKPFINNGRTMVPMRRIFEAFNAKVEWEETGQTITASKNGSVIVLKINNSEMLNNGVSQTLDTVPVIIGDTAYVPLRAVSQALNAKVDWLEYTQSVYINSPDKYSADFLEYSKKLDDGELPESSRYVIMYAPDGRTIKIPKEEIEAYKGVGWYTEPVVMMYAADGRTIYVAESEKEAYEKVGWYINLPENLSNYNVYITPKGSKYHYSADCAGKNAISVELNKAKNIGYSACSKCSK